MKFAIVDIETTGLYHQGHAITEVAVVHMDDNAPPAHAFHSLIRPERDIPSMVSALTGIDSGLLSEAPSFGDIARPLLEALENRVFVAHNVHFDYRFLEAAFLDLGITFRLKRLCTMRYARKVLPGLSSYRLATVCRELSVPNSDPHRAGGDAWATADLLGILLSRDKGHRVLDTLLARTGHMAVLPSAVDPEVLRNIPESPGVYYFRDSRRNPIYIGKAKNLRRRILSHFTSSGSTGRKQLFQQKIAMIDYRLEPSDYFASLREDADIKRFRPRFNRAQKNFAKSYALVCYTDRSGMERLALQSTSHCPEALAWFNSPISGRAWLQEACAEYGFHPGRAGLPAVEDVGRDSSPEVETAAFRCFVADRQQELSASFALAIPFGEELCYALVVHGRYRGFGRVPRGIQLSLELCADHVTKAPDSPVARAVVRKMAGDRHIFRCDF